MGAWGIGLYQDDMALDIRDTVKDELRFGTPLNEIITQLKLNYDIDKYDNNDEESVFWCALADTLWQLGRLDDKIKNKALSYIERGADIERWMSEDSRLALKREKSFSKFKSTTFISATVKKNFIQTTHLCLSVGNRRYVCSKTSWGNGSKEGNKWYVSFISSS